MARKPPLCHPPHIALNIQVDNAEIAKTLYRSRCRRIAFGRGSYISDDGGTGGKDLVEIGVVMALIGVDVRERILDAFIADISPFTVSIVDKHKLVELWSKVTKGARA